MSDVPKTREEAFLLAENIAKGACDVIARKTGERPHTERRGDTVVVVWPDGEVTNEITVEYMQ